MVSLPSFVQIWSVATGREVRKVEHTRCSRQLTFTTGCTIMAFISVTATNSFHHSSCLESTAAASQLYMVRQLQSVELMGL